MALTLHLHPLSSFCWKVSVALYESGLAFDVEQVDLSDEEGRSRFYALWPMGKMPVLVDAERGRTLAETSIILEYFAQRFTEAAWLIPSDPERALDVRFRDRFCDLYLQLPMQKITGDRIRAADIRDPHGVRLAQADLGRALDYIEAGIGSGHWPVGAGFTMADCAAGPGLFYANLLQPFEATHPAVWRYLEHLKRWPAFARVLDEAQPWFKFFPAEKPG